MSNSHLQELIKTHKTPSLRLPKNFANHVKIERLDDPGLPQIIAKKQSSRDVLEITFFPSLALQNEKRKISEKTQIQ